MNLAELYAQQQRDIETFKTLRDDTWANLKAEHELLIAAFGSREQMPEEYQKRIDQQLRDYTKEWSMAGGERHSAILEQHAKQREAVTGRKRETEQQPEPQKDTISDKQQQLEKIIAQQQAIRKKQEERKRSRRR